MSEELQIPLLLDHDTKSALIRSYRALYDHLYDLSWKEDDILEELINKFSNRDKEKGITLRKQYSVKDLEYYFDGWWGYSDKVKSSILWSVGFNNKEFPVTKIKGLFRDYENKLHYGEILYCQERTDKDWITGRVEGYSVASTDAVVMGSIYKWGYDFRKDLQQEKSNV